MTPVSVGRMMIGGAGSRARWRKVRDLHEVSGRRSRGLVVLLFDLAFELPQRLTDQIARAPVNRIGDPGILQFTHYFINGSVLPMCKSREKN
jgi:hypothetical protein